MVNCFCTVYYTYTYLFFCIVSLQISRLSRLLDGAESEDFEESLADKKLSPSEGHSFILIVLSALQVTVYCYSIFLV